MRSELTKEGAGATTAFFDEQDKKALGGWDAADNENYPHLGSVGSGVSQANNNNSASGTLTRSTISRQRECLDRGQSSRFCITGGGTYGLGP